MQVAQFIDVEGVNIAYRHVAGDAPGLVWLGGFKSDMMGTKAEVLSDWAKAQGRQFTRFDYSGHGESGGEFVDGTISKWLNESLAIIEQICQGPQLLVGSSMGGWIALRAVQMLRQRGQAERVQGLLLLAPAPDFTSVLMEPQLTEEQRTALETRGYFEEPTEYSDIPNIFTRALFDDGRKNRVMDGAIETGCPVHIIQGMQDNDVPHTHALALVNHLPLDQVTMTLVGDGDHRLSRDEDLALLVRIVETFD